MEDVEYTELDKKLIAQYEERTGRKIGTLDERYFQFKKMNPADRNRFHKGAQSALWARWDLDNDDVFDGEDDVWKEKVLKENISLLEQIAKEEIRNK